MRGNAEVSQTDLRLAAITQMHQSSEKAWVGGLAVESFGRTSESVAAVRCLGKVQPPCQLVVIAGLATITFRPRKQVAR